MSISASDLYALHTFSQPLALPDGGVVAVVNWLNQATNTYQHKLQYFGDQDLSFGFDHKHDTAPALAPDGESLAWLSQAPDRTTQVFTQSFHGVVTQRTWLPNGVKRFLWLRNSRGWLVQTTDTSKTASDFPHPQTLTHLHFQDNGGGLRKEDQNSQLWTQGMASSDAKLLFNSREQFQLRTLNSRHAVITQESLKHLSSGAFATTASFIDLVSGQATAFFTGHGSVQALSEDDTVLFSGDPDDETGWFGTTLFTSHHGAVTPLLSARDVEVGNHVMSDSQMNFSGKAARFATDGSVVFTYSRAGHSYLAKTLPNGDFQTLETPSGAVCDFNLAEDDTPLFTHSDHTHVSQLFKGAKLLGESLPNWSAQAPVDFSFERADFTIHGWYFKPQYDAPHPTVLSVHGGPHAAYGNSYFHEFQTYLAAGYGVIAINPRGSATYGQAFQSANIGDYGGNDFADLLAGVEAAKKLDENIDQLFLTGGSYGGFIANWAETHTTLFDGIVSERAISNWVSFYGTSDIGYFFAPRELGGTELKNMWRQSPLAYVDNAKTPLLLIHSDEDLRVPIGQAEEFYTALKLRGVDVTFWRFPASNHSLSRSGLPNLRVERLAGTIAWFDQRRKH